MFITDHEAVLTRVRDFGKEKNGKGRGSVFTGPEEKKVFVSPVSHFERASHGR